MKILSIKKQHSGFTLLFALLISSLALAIGFAIFNIAIKESILTATIRDSQFAFYAADSGAECALYWDFQHNAFSTEEVSNIRCNDGTVQQVGGTEVSTFTMTFPPQAYCAEITVDKSDGGTEIVARGYNTCNTENLRRVERAIRVQY